MLNVFVENPSKRGVIKECKGLVFRPYQSFFYHDFRFEQKIGMKLLKRKSCLGCEVCYDAWGFVKDILMDYSNLPIKGEIDTRKLYSIHIDEDDMYFEEIKK